MRSLRKFILPLLLALATVFAGSSLAQPAHDDCGCCTEMQKMMCAACKTCASHALLTSAAVHIEETPGIAVRTTPALNPSGHTEDIWHPPRRPS